MQLSDITRLSYAVCLLTITCLIATPILISILLIEVDPGFLFLLLAPPVLFHAAGSLPKAHLSQSTWHITLLGIVGVGTGAVMTAVIMRYAFPIQMDLASQLPAWRHCCCH